LKHVVHYFLSTEIKAFQTITFAPNCVEHFNKELVFSEGKKKFYF